MVWYETFPTALQAIEAEKRVKGWTRAKKIALIESVNPRWRDLGEDEAPILHEAPEPRDDRHPEPSAAKDLGNRGRRDARDASLRQNSAQHDVSAARTDVPG